MPRRPAVVARPLREVVAEVRRHNAAVLARPLPGEAPHGILDMLLEGFQPVGALSYLDKPQARLLVCALVQSGPESDNMEDCSCPDHAGQCLRDL